MQILQYAIGNTGQQTRAHAIGSREQHQRQHAAGGHAAALGHAVQPEAAEHKGKRNGQGSESDGLGVPLLVAFANHDQHDGQRCHHSHGHPHRTGGFGEFLHQFLPPGGCSFRRFLSGGFHGFHSRSVFGKCRCEEKIHQVPTSFSVASGIQKPTR